MYCETLPGKRGNHMSAQHGVFFWLQHSHAMGMGHWGPGSNAHHRKPSP